MVSVVALRKARPLLRLSAPAGTGGVVHSPSRYVELVGRSGPTTQGTQPLAVR
jgi:hypothetical protein